MSKFIVKLKALFGQIFGVHWLIAAAQQASAPISSTFFEEVDCINKINFKRSIKRVASDKKRSLIVDPLKMQDIIWFVENKEPEFKKLMQCRYFPSRQITLSMPKGNLTYRPISYLSPIDSLLYQALVDNIVKYKHNKFSKHVYSEVLNTISCNEVINNPVQHWLEMRNNLRKQYANGYNIYFTTDISGYFENIKIKKLLEAIDFYIGRNETSFKKILEKLICKWQYAESQGLIQTHPASSILGKIYLTTIDSQLSYLSYRYSRYVDEFHIMSKSNKDVIKITIELNDALRELGLNLNLTKTKILRDQEIAQELDEDKDFFDSVNYWESLRIHDVSLGLVKQKFIEIEQRYREENKINKKVFRYCIHKFQREKVNDGINFSLEMLRQFPDQTIDIVKYLAHFINSGDYIINYIVETIMNKEINLYQWQQIWLLALLLEVDKGKP